MPTQFENPEATKLEDKTVSSETAEKAIERIAEKVAQKSTLQKSTLTEHKYDKDHKIFTI
jgi:hypothetical protein